MLGAAVMPALGRRITVRPPRQGQPRPGSGPDARPKGPAAGRGGQSEFTPISGVSANVSDRRDRAPRTRGDGHGGRADSIPGT